MRISFSAQVCSNVIQCKYCDATMTYHRSAESRVKGGATAEGAAHRPIALPLLPGG
jgi:hypothetical protein